MRSCDSNLIFLQEYPYIFTNKNSDVAWSSEKSEYASKTKDTDSIQDHNDNYQDIDRIPFLADYVPNDYMKMQAHAADTENASTDKHNMSGLAIGLVAIVGLLVLALGLTMVVPYWRKTHKQKRGDGSIENPVFEYDVHVE